MDQKVLNFLKNQRVSAFTTLLKDGSPHTSAMHFSYDEERSVIYIQTENNSKKCEAFSNSNSVKGSFVIGFSEDEFVTLQMDGEAKTIKDTEELKKVHKIHYSKNPDAEQWKDDPATLFLCFRPKWWRYTEYKPKFIVIESK